MRAPFPPSSNFIAQASLVALALLTAGAVAFGTVYERSPARTGVGFALEQPILFSHRHHVQGLGLDCRYCHASVDRAAFAGFPDTATCMGCHATIWPTTPALEKLRASWEKHEPLEWEKVNVLPDHVYFHHAAHVQKGIGCASCHGDVSRSDAIAKHRSFWMRDCLDCHQDPSAFLRAKNDPVDAAGNADSAEERRERMREWNVRTPPLSDCRTCHR